MRAVIHKIYMVDFTTTRPPSLSPLAEFVLMAVPGILVKLLADKARPSAGRRGLFNESHVGRLLSVGIELVTWIGRSKIVYSSVPFNLKFCLIEIYKSVSR
jgi:hypothetical protein